MIETFTDLIEISWRDKRLFRNDPMLVRYIANDIGKVADDIIARGFGLRKHSSKLQLTSY